MIEYKNVVILKDDEGIIKDVIATETIDDFFEIIVQNDMWNGEFELLSRYDNNDKEYYILTLKYKSIEESVNEEKSKVDGANIK